MKTLCLAAAAVMGLVAWAQEGTSESSVTLKIYNEASFSDVYRIVRSDLGTDFGFISVESRYALLRPTFAVQWGGVEKGAQEIEVNRLSYGVSDYYFSNEASNIGTFELALRYDYTIAAFKSDNEKWLLTAAVGAMPFFEHRRMLAGRSDLFPTNEIRVGTQVTVTPRLLYSITDRLLLDINVPFALVEAQYFTQEVEDPSVPKEQRTLSASPTEVFPNYLALRIGLGYRL